MNIWVTADHHFWHKNILEYEKEARSIFKDVEDMNEQMIARWNEVVSKEDTVYHLGDFCLANKEKTRAILDRLNFWRIFLIRGNHEQCRTTTWLKDVGFTEVFREPCCYGDGSILLSHHPLVVLPSENIKTVIHGHIHSKDLGTDNDAYKRAKYINVSVEKTNFYPVRLESLI